MIILLILLIVFILMNKQEEKFMVKQPYDSLDTTYYKDMYYDKMTPYLDPTGRGYYKNYLDYYDNPNLLDDYRLGYSIGGIPYSNMKFSDSLSKKYVDLQNPHHRFEYPNWYSRYPTKAAYYYGYPFYFFSKIMH